MTTDSLAAVRRTLAVGLLALCSVQAQAHLAGDIGSIASEQTLWNATQTFSTASGYALYTLTTPQGVVVREYVNATGLVFAVGWDGPLPPDVQTLLGSYYPLYAQALARKARTVSIQQNGVVIESGGMMRAFFGRAYLSDQLPLGVSTANLH